jgi:hypothetical protein
MLEDKIRQTVENVLSRLEEQRKLSSQEEDIWAGRHFTQIHGGGEYEVGIKIRLKR